ncbi:MAG: RNA polymerase sigma factor [Planctomycetota bacterium]
MTHVADARLERCFELCAKPAWRLAYCYGRDAHEAYDVVQQAFLVAASKPECIPVEPADPWPWFSVVVLNEARNSRRKKRPSLLPRRADNFESEWEMVDRRAPQPDEKMLRHESQHELWRAVDELPATERIAIVLTYMSGFTHVRAAEMLKIPVKTLSSHVGRGLERLRGRLRLAEATLPGSLAICPIELPPGGWEQALAGWKSVSFGKLGAAAGSAAVASESLVSGGIIMSAKKSLVAMTAVGAVLGLTAGAWVGGRWRATEAARASALLAESAALAIQNSGVDSSAATDPSLKSTPVSPGAAELAHVAQARLEAENAKLHAQVEALAMQLKSLNDSLHGAGPTFTFGECGQMEPVLKANWRELAEAASIVGEDILELSELHARGDSPPRELELRLQENVERVRKYEFRVVGKFPTASEYNGELTHPISHANLLAAVLDRAGLPMTAAQIERVTRCGESYDRHYQLAIATYRDDTLRAQKLLDEYTLKGEFVDQVYDALSAEQREVVANPRTLHLANLDMFCPTLMLIHSSPIVTGESNEEIRGKLAGVLTGRYQLTPEQLTALTVALDGWLEDVAPALEPAEVGRVRNYSFDQGVVAGHATVTLLGAIAALADLPDAMRATVRNDPAFFIPRVTRSPATEG